MEWIWRLKTLKSLRNLTSINAFFEVSLLSNLNPLTFPPWSKAVKWLDSVLRKNGPPPAKSTMRLTREPKQGKEKMDLVSVYIHIYIYTRTQRERDARKPVREWGCVSA